MCRAARLDCCTLSSHLTLCMLPQHSLLMLQIWINRPLSLEKS